MVVGLNNALAMSDGQVPEVDGTPRSDTVENDRATLPTIGGRSATSSTSASSTTTTMAANAYADDPFAPSSRPAGLTYGGAGRTVSDLSIMIHSAKLILLIDHWWLSVYDWFGSQREASSAICFHRAFMSHRLCTAVGHPLDPSPLRQSVQESV